MGFWSDERGTNLLDSGAPFYDVYRCADGDELAVAALEPQFFAALLDVLGARPRRRCPARTTSSAGPSCATALTAGVASQPRERWLARAEGRDACLAPVLHDARGRRPPARPGPRHGGGGRRRRRSPRRRRASRPPRRPSIARRRSRASTPTRCWSTCGFSAAEVDRAPGATAPSADPSSGCSVVALLLDQPLEGGEDRLRTAHGAPSPAA